jgi:hypothetical protein
MISSATPTFEIKDLAVPNSVNRATRTALHQHSVGALTTTQHPHCAIPPATTQHQNCVTNSNPSVHTPSTGMLNLALALTDVAARTPAQDKALRESVAHLTPAEMQQVLSKLEPEDVEHIFHGDLFRSVAEMGPRYPPRPANDAPANPARAAAAPSATPPRVHPPTHPARVLNLHNAGRAAPPKPPTQHADLSRERTVRTLYHTENEWVDNDGNPEDWDHFWDNDGAGEQPAEGEGGEEEEDPEYQPVNKYSEEYDSTEYAVASEVIQLQKAVKAMATNMVGLITLCKTFEQGLDYIDQTWRDGVDGPTAFTPSQFQDASLHNLTNQVKQAAVQALKFLPGESPTQDASAQQLQPQSVHHHATVPSDNAAAVHTPHAATPVTAPAAAPIAQAATPVSAPQQHVHNTGYTIKASAPKLAKGGDVRDFLAKMKIYFHLAKVPASEQINHALLCVDSPDLVDMWIGHAKNSPHSEFTFQDFADRLTIFAGGHSVQSKALDDFYSCRQNKQSVDAYIRKFNSLVTAAELQYGSPVVINAFLRGLADDAFRALICVHPSGAAWTNLSDLQAHASTRAVAARPTHGAPKPTTSTPKTASNTVNKRRRADAGPAVRGGRGGRGRGRGRGRTQQNSGYQQRDTDYQRDSYRQSDQRGSA